MKRVLVFAALALTLLPMPARAEVQVVEADSSYLIGDNDSKIDARRIVLQEAKRKALEMAGVLVESITEVKNLALTRDEIRAYTAGIVETEIVTEEMKGTSDHPEIYMKTRCRIDMGVLMEQIKRLKADEGAKEQLQVALKENEALRKERDGLVTTLATEKNKTKADDIRKKLNTVLAKEESNDEVKRVWGNLSTKVDLNELGKSVKEGTAKDLDEAAATLEKVIRNNPDNVRAYMLLAMIHAKRGDKAKAESEFRAAIRINPDNPFAHEKLANLLRHTGRKAEAVDEYRTVQRLKPNDPTLLLRIGMVFRESGECGQALPYLRKFLKAAQENGKVPAEMKQRALNAVKECSGERKRPVRQRWERP
jgi:predicted Zn-dependent protease